MSINMEELSSIGFRNDIIVSRMEQARLNLQMLLHFEEKGQASLVKGDINANLAILREISKISGKVEKPTVKAKIKKS